jgi:hypothetical protein
MVELTPVTVEDGHNGQVVFSQRVKGWIGSGFNSQTTKISTRRVRKKDQTEEVQVGIEIITFKGDNNRMYSIHAGLTLDAETTDKLVKSLTTVWKEKLTIL